jgi:hypothetical protein
MKNLLLINTFLLLLTEASLSLEKKNWQIIEDENKKDVYIFTHGEITYGDRTYFYIFNNNGKCDYIEHFITFYTTAKNDNILKISGKNIRAKSLNKIINLSVITASDFLLGHTVSLRVGSFPYNEYVLYLKDKKQFDILILDNLEEINTGNDQKFIKNFKANQYFDIKNNYWKLDGFNNAIKKAQDLCLQ